MWKVYISLWILLGVSFGLGYIVHRQIHKDELWGNYERGAWAVMKHHVTYGNYGSQGYRIIAYEWGDPQTEEDVKMLVKMVEEEWPENEIFN